MTIRLAPPPTTHLHQFMNWFLAGTLVMIVSQVVASVLVPVLSLRITTAGTIGFGVLALLAKHYLTRQQPLRTVTILATGLNLLAVLDVLAQPLALPLLVLLPLMGVALALPYVPSLLLRQLSVVAGATIVAITLLAQFVQLFPPSPALATTSVRIVGISAASGLILLLLWHYHSQLNVALGASQMATTALQAAQVSLEQQIATRTAALQTALTEVQAHAVVQEQLLGEVAQQRSAIRALSVPILPVSTTTLVMPLIGALDTQRLRDVQNKALQAIARTNVRRLIVDITGVPVVDAQVAQGLLMVVQAAKLLGVTVILVGVRPEVAQTVVDIGSDVGSIHTAATLQAALVKEFA